MFGRSAKVSSTAQRVVEITEGLYRFADTAELSEETFVGGILFQCGVQDPTPADIALCLWPGKTATELIVPLFRQDGPFAHLRGGDVRGPYSPMASCERVRFALLCGLEHRSPQRAAHAVCYARTLAGASWDEVYPLVAADVSDALQRWEDGGLAVLSVAMYARGLVGDEKVSRYLTDAALEVETQRAKELIDGSLSALGF